MPTLFTLLQDALWKSWWGPTLADTLLDMAHDLIFVQHVLPREWHPRRIHFHVHKQIIMHKSTRVHHLQDKHNKHAYALLVAKLICAVQRCNTQGATELHACLMHALGLPQCVALEEKKIKRMLTKFLCNMPQNTAHCFLYPQK